MKKHFSAGNILPEGTLPTKIQLFKTGNNPNSYKNIAIYNPELKDIILSNQLEKDGRDLLPIDLEHLRGSSQGWFTLSLDDTGIYADNIQWTNKGKEALSNREFRFYSPTFMTDKEGNITQIDSFALTNSPALYGLTPIVASKEKVPTIENKVIKELETMSTENTIEAADPVVDTTVVDASVDEKDKQIADLTAQNESLQSHLADALSKLDEISQAEMAKEKDSILSSLELSSDAEKLFFSRMNVDSLKEYALIVASKKTKQSIVEPIVVETKEFVNNKKPNTNVVEMTKGNLPTLEQLQAQAQRFANQRNTK
jgi:hypothetical protein